MTGELVNVETGVVSSPVKSLEPFSSIKGDDLDKRFEIAAAVMGATPIADVIGVPLQVQHIIRQPVEVTNEQTRQVELALRTTLLLEDGTAVASVSRGIDIAIDNILNTLGSPEFWDGRSFEFVAERRGSGTSQYFTLVPVLPKKAPAKK